MPHDLLLQLETWAAGRQILPSLFKCQHYPSCSQDHKNLKAGASVCMSYVGPMYERPIDRHDIRLVIVGIDHGAGAEDYVSRRQAILSIPSRGGFNPHYRGIVKTAAAIFGRETRCVECAEKNHCQKNSGPDRRCALEMFAQPNLVKCANGADMKSRSTSTMMTNCSTLLIEEIELLRPTLIVLHGVGLRHPFKAAVRSRGWTHCSVAGDTTGCLHEIIGSQVRAHVLYLAHPSLGHLSRQWTAIVEPALAQLRQMGILPA